MARTLRVVSATNQQTKYGYSSFNIRTAPQSPSSKYYYKLERVDIPDETLRINLEDDWIEYTNGSDIWVDSNVTVTFVECITNLLQAYGYCTSVSHRLSKYMEITSVSETSTPDELLLSVNLREFDYGNEEEDTVVDDIIFANDYNQEDDEDAVIYDYNSIEDGGSNIPPFLQLKYYYKIELFKASAINIRVHDLPFGTTIEDIDEYTEWNTKDKIQIHKEKGYQKAYTIWFYVADEENRALDFTYITGDLSTTSGYVLPLLFRSKADKMHPGYTMLNLKNVITEEYDKPTIEPSHIDWDMPDTFEYGYEDEDIIDLDPDDDNNFGDDDIDDFIFNNGAYYYDFIYDKEPEIYYYIGKKINGYYDFSSDFKLYKGGIIGPIDRGTVVTLIQWDGHTYKYGTIFAEVDDGSGEEMYFTIESHRANRKFYSTIIIDNDLYPGNTYLYKYIESTADIPEYLQIIGEKDGYTVLGTSNYTEVYSEEDDALLCVCEVDPNGKVYRLGTVNVKINTGEISYLDGYICETKTTNGNSIKIDIRNKNEDHVCYYYYNTKDYIPTRYHERIDNDIWEQFIPDYTDIFVNPSTKVIILEATETGLSEATGSVITPTRYNLDTINVSIVGSNIHENTVTLSVTVDDIKNYYYKIDGDIRAYWELIDDTWLSLPSDFIIEVDPNSNITIVKVDDLNRSTAIGKIITPAYYQDLNEISVIVLSTSAEANRVNIRIPQATANTQYYYNANGIQVEYYKQFIDLNKWTRLPIGQFATESLTECSVTAPPNSSLIFAQTDALYNATGKGSLVTPPIYDSMRQLSVTISATIAQTTKVYIIIGNTTPGCTYYYKNGDASFSYLDPIDSSWTLIGVDNSVTAPRSSLVTVVEVNADGKIVANAKFTTPAMYTGDEDPTPGPGPTPDTPIPTIVKYTLNKAIVIKEIPNRKSGDYNCTSCSGFTFNSGKTNGFVVKSYTVSSEQRTSRFTCTFDKITGIRESNPGITKYTICNANGTPQKVARHHNDMCYGGKYNDEYLFFHALMNDTTEDPYQVIATNNKGVVIYKLQVLKNGKAKSVSSITFYKKDTNGDLLFITGNGSISYEDGTRRKYGIYRFNGSSLVYDNIEWTTYSKIPDIYTAQGIYYNPDTEELYIPFFDNSKSEVRFNHILVFDIKNAVAGSYMYCTKHIEITGPSGHAFEIESLDMTDDKTIYAAVNRTNGLEDAVMKITFKKK